MLPNKTKERESETKRFREGIKRVIEKKRETEREIAWKEESGRQERSGDTPLRETEGVIK